MIDLKNAARNNLVEIVGWGALLLANLRLIFLPLAKYFHYEFAALNAVLVTLIFGIVVAVRMRAATPENLATFARRFWKSAVTFVVAPFLVAAINAATRGDCPFLDGVGFYLALVVSAPLVGAALGAGGALLSRRFGWALVPAFVAYLLVVPSALFLYRLPQVYFFNPVFGFFPGVIYDHSIELSSALVWYRVFESALAVGAIWLALRWIRSGGWKPRVAFATIALGLCAAFQALAPVVGLATDRARIESELTLHISTPRFEIRMPASADSTEALYVALLHERYHAELGVLFGVEPRERIVSFLFADADQRKRLFGSRNANVAKPWQGQMYLTLGAMEGSLKHELAHLFAAEFGRYPFRIAKGANMAAIEGVAVFADPDYGGYDLEFMAAVARRAGKLPEPTRLFGGLRFFGSVSSLSYVSAGAFFQFLARRGGAEKLEDLYATLEFERIYGEPLAALSDRFLARLDSIDATGTEAIAAYHFGGKALVARRCPRFVADMRVEANRLFSERRFAEAAMKFEELREYADDGAAVYGLAASYDGAGRTDDAAELLRREYREYAGTSYYYRMRLVLADYSLALGDSATARAYYDSLALERPSLRYEWIAALRLRLTEKGFSTARAYAVGGNYERYRIVRELCRDTLVPEAALASLSIAERLNLDYETTIRPFDDLAFGDDYLSTMAATSLCKLATKNLDFARALRFAEIIERSDNEFTRRSSTLARGVAETSRWISRSRDSILARTEIRLVLP